MGMGRAEKKGGSCLRMPLCLGFRPPTQKPPPFTSRRGEREKKGVSSMLVPHKAATAAEHQLSNTDLVESAAADLAASHVIFFSVSTYPVTASPCLSRRETRRRRALNFSLRRSTQQEHLNGDDDNERHDATDAARAFITKP